MRRPSNAFTRKEQANLSSVSRSPAGARGRGTAATKRTTSTTTTTTTTTTTSVEVAPVTESSSRSSSKSRGQGGATDKDKSGGASSASTPVKQGSGPSGSDSPSPGAQTPSKLSGRKASQLAKRAALAKKKKLLAEMEANRLQREEEIKAQIEQNKRISAWMMSVGAVQPEDPLASVIEAMHISKSTRVFVVSLQGDVMGIISLKDIAKEIIRREGNLHAKQVDELQILAADEED